MKLSVRVTPRGGRDAVEGWARDEAGRPILKIRVATAGAGGAANASVLAVLAKALGRPKSALTLVSGQTARVKRIEVEGMDETQVFAVLGAP